MSLAKQARTLTDAQIRALLSYAAASRYPERDAVMVLLSVRAGMRAIEIAGLTWSMVTLSDGATMAEDVSIRDGISKGRSSGRSVPMHPELKAALTVLRLTVSDARAAPDRPIIYSERARGMSRVTVSQWFGVAFDKLGIEGASSHSGRRTFITRVARKISSVGGSLRDVQALAGHASISTTQRYIDENQEAKRKVVTGM